MRGLRGLTLALALIAGGLAAADYLGWRQERQRVLGLAATSRAGAHLPGLEARLARETVPARAADRLAWHLVGLELDRGWLDGLTPGERRLEVQRGPERLQLARRLAREALARQPAAWRSAAALGAGRYLEAARLGRQDQPTGAWRDPLRTAMRLAPGRAEPALMLASFYLSRWSSLSPGEREEVPEVLTRAFAEPRGLRRLLPAWVRLAPSLAELLRPIPDQPGAWRELGRQFLRLGDLERFGVSHQRQRQSLRGDLARRVEAGRARLRGGKRKAGRGLLLSVLAAPPDLAYLDSFVAAFSALPEGSHPAETRADLRAWLAWAGDLCALGRCPLEAATMRRLAAAGGDEGGGAPPSRPDPPARTSWPADAWQRHGEVSRLVLRTAVRGRGLRLEIGGLPAAGGAVELAWDGRFAGVAVVYPGEPLSWPLAVEPGLHLLQVRHLTGRPLQPRELTLEPPRATG